MAVQTENALRAFVTSMDVPPYCRVKLDSNGKATLAGAGEDFIGISQPAHGASGGTAVSGTQVNVALRFAGRTYKMTASGAITLMNRVYGDASGKISATVLGQAEGLALNAASNSGDVVEVLLCFPSLGSGPGTTADSLADIMLQPTATTQKGLVMQAKLNQTANILEFQSSVGAILAAISASGLILESAQDTITAFAGGGQASATQITGQTVRITTVATAGDSVKLPPSVAGLEVLVINHGANPCQVFGAGTDKIDDVASATGVSQMQMSLVIYTCATAGNWYSEGLATGFGGPGLATASVTNGITAYAGGGQANAVALTSMINRIGTVATQGDSVKLPASAVGSQVLIINRGANACQVFGAGTDTINGIATATGISHGVNQTALYTCSVAGNWEVQFSLPQQAALVALSVNGAIPAHVAHSYVITKGSILAETLGAPTAGTDDGLIITVLSSTAFAHTITATGLLQTGTASVNVATFAANAGASLTLQAYNGKWIVIASNGITFS